MIGLLGHSGAPASTLMFLVSSVCAVAVMRRRAKRNAPSVNELTFILGKPNFLCKNFVILPGRVAFERPGFDLGAKIEVFLKRDTHIGFINRIKQQSELMKKSETPSVFPNGFTKEELVVLRYPVEINENAVVVKIQIASVEERPKKSGVLEVHAKKVTSISNPDKMVITQLIGDEQHFRMKPQLSKRDRHIVFAKWALDTFEIPKVILDVAGGKGFLAEALSDRFTETTIYLVDPCAGRGRAGRGRGTIGTVDANSLSSQNEKVTHVPATLEEALKKRSEMLPAIKDRESALLLGLHPDEATEAIIDHAIANKW
jgi:hypothetical protein